MSDDASNLPDDIAALRMMVLEHRAELTVARSGLIEQRYEIDKQLAEIVPADEPVRDDTEDHARKPVRGPLPPALPRDVVEHPAPCGENGGCPACGGQLRALGANETEILDYVPGTFRVVRRHVRPKLSCRSCETIVQAPMPDLPIRRGRAGAGLIAHVLTAKYCDHQPLHRQAEQYAREDVDLSRSTLADMAGQAARLLRPLVDALGRHVMSGQRVHADDTTVPVLARGLGRTKTGRIWTYVVDDRPFGGATSTAVFYEVGDQVALLPSKRLGRKTIN